MTEHGLVATLLPFEYDPDAGEHGALIGHMARGNDQWRQPVQGEAMVLVHGPQAYVTPSWYPTKQVHHRVVPTWNYMIAHVYGQLVVHDDPAWTEAQIRRLTDRHETGDWDFDGHQLVTHLAAQPSVPVGFSSVEQHSVPVPHVGLLLTGARFHGLADRLRAARVGFGIEPCLRCAGEPAEQWTMFLHDPAGNALEFKAFTDESAVFAR